MWLTAIWLTLVNAFLECYSEGIRGEPGAVTPRVEVCENSKIEVDATCDNYLPRA